MYFYDISDVSSAVWNFGFAIGSSFTVGVECVTYLKMLEYAITSNHKNMNISENADALRYVKLNSTRRFRRVKLFQS